jgi:hypothetical protein
MLKNLHNVGSGETAEKERKEGIAEELTAGVVREVWGTEADGGESDVDEKTERSGHEFMRAVGQGREKWEERQWGENG